MTKSFIIFFVLIFLYLAPAGECATAPPPMNQRPPAAVIKPAIQPAAQHLQPTQHMPTFRPQAIQMPTTLTMTGMKFTPKDMTSPLTLQMTGMKFYQQTLTGTRTLAMTGMKFHPQTLTATKTLEITGMKFHPQTITLPVTLEMNGMPANRLEPDKMPLKDLPPPIEKRTLP